jgi:hypothetical protein
VLSTYMGQRYAFMSGTSMATPHVSGAAALYRAMYPGSSPAQVRRALQATGTLDWRTGTDPDHNPERALWVGDLRRPPDFSLSAADPGATTPGGLLEVSVQVRRVGGFDAPVSIALASPPDGFSATSVVAEGRVATLQIDVAGNTLPGTYELTIAGLGMDVEHRATIQVAIRRR